MSGSRKGSEICTEGVGELDVRLQEGVRDLHGRGRRRGRRSARKGSESWMPGCLEGVGDLSGRGRRAGCQVSGRGRRAGCQAVWNARCLEGVGELDARLDARLMPGVGKYIHILMHSGTMCCVNAATQHSRHSPYRLKRLG